MTRQVCCECPFVGSARKKSRSRDAARTRVIVTASNKTTKPFALRTDLRQRIPAVDTGILTICALSHECKKRRKGKRNADQRWSVSSASLDAARALQSALANRRSTTALCLWEYFIPRLKLG